MAKKSKLSKESHSIKHEPKSPKSIHKKKTPKPKSPNPETSSLTTGSILSLLEPYQKDQLVTFLIDAIIDDPSLLSLVNRLADSDTQHQKLFIHGFSHDATKEDIFNSFSPFGEIEDYNMVCEKNSTRSKGYGFLTFKTRVSASQALQEPHKKIGTRVTTCQLAALGPKKAESRSGSATNPAGVASQFNPYVASLLGQNPFLAVGFNPFLGLGINDATWMATRVGGRSEGASLLGAYPGAAAQAGHGLGGS